MAGFVKEVTPRLAAIDYAAEAMSFPWKLNSAEVSLYAALGRRISCGLFADAPYPPYTRSLRDGYAVQSTDVVAATPGTPTFLKKVCDVPMGVIPDCAVFAGEAASIPTGGVLPSGADSVVMLEDTDITGGWVEVRRGIQSGENVIQKGEEFPSGCMIMKRGELVDFRTVSLLSTIGLDHVPVQELRIRVLSTGDEIVPVDTEQLPPGCVRDVNGMAVCALLAKYGFPAEYRGIVKDDAEEFEKRVLAELAECDVLILSGGSSVGVRDNCSRVLENLPKPGLLVRGINIVPGKPTLIAGCAEEKKLVVSLPGHPLSCVSAAFTVLLPLLLKMSSNDAIFPKHRLFLELSRDLNAKTGPEEFTPCTVGSDGKAYPISAKSGYISVLSDSDGLIRVPEDMETVRAGEHVEVWLW